MVAARIEAPLDVYAKAVDLEEVLQPVEAAPGEELERGVRSLVGVASRLALLDLGQSPSRRGSERSKRSPKRSSSAMRLERPAWSETIHATPVPHRLRAYVFIGLRRLQDRRGMDAGLGREGGGADVGRLGDQGPGSTARRRRARRESASKALPAEMPVSNFSANADFRSSVGMIEVRSALPQRSPMPFSVPWICRAPARTAASELATAFPVSLCAWMPIRSFGSLPRRR